MEKDPRSTDRRDTMRKIWLSFLLIVGLEAPIASCPAAVPALINYQGRLVKDGTNLVNGTVGLSLRIFDTSSGGNLLYEDSNTVVVVDGLYATYIGDDTTFGTLTNALATPAAYLETMVDGIALLPRDRLGSVAYALSAQTAQGVMAGGISSEMIAAGAVGPMQLAADAVTSAAIADGAIFAADLASNAVTTAAIADGAITAVKLSQAYYPLPPITITNPAPSAQAAFGHALCNAGGARFVVGAPGDGAGSAYLFDLNGTRVASITNRVPTPDSQFGYAVGCVGNRIVIGAPLQDTGATDAGAAYYYDLNGTYYKTFANPTPMEGDQFGLSVAGIGNSHLVVGACYDDTGETNAGSAYLYYLNGTLAATVPNPAPGADDHFGFSVAGVDSNRMAVGAPGSSAQASRSGLVYVYGTAGNLLVSVTNPLPSPDANFGYAVAGMGSNQFVVGAPGAAPEGTADGCVFLYDEEGHLLATVTNPAPDAYDSFGRTVSGVGFRGFVVGAHPKEDDGAQAGGAFYYDSSGTLQMALANPTPATNDQYGFAMAAVGDSLLLVSAPYDDTDAADSGCAYLYAFGAYAGDLVAASVRPEGVTPEMLAPEVDQLFVNVDGDTMTGALTAPVVALTYTGATVNVQAGELTRRTAPIASIAATGTTTMASFNAYNCTASRLATGTYRVAFTVPPATAFYTPVIMPLSPTPCFATVTTRISSRFDFQLHDTAGTPQDGAFSVIVFGGY